MTQNAAPVLLVRQLKAALALHGMTVARLAKRLDISEGYLWRVVSGKAVPAAALWARIGEQLGPSGWAFATGQSSELRLSGAHE